MARNLKKTLQIEDVEYNINAVYSDEAGKVTKPLTIEKSLLGGHTKSEYNGSDEAEINFVPSSGGLFEGQVFIENGYDKNKLSDVIPADVKRPVEVFTR